MTDDGKTFDPLCACERALLAAAIADRTTADYVVVRALAALGQESPDRLARLTTMGRQFVAAMRQRVLQRGAAVLLADPPSAGERVLETATRQLLEAGRRELAMRTVSHEAGVPRRSLYRLHSSSAALVQTCQRRAQTVWRGWFEQCVLAAATDPCSRLFAVFDVVESWIGSERFRRDLALRARPWFGGELRDDVLREHLAEIDRFATVLGAGAQLAAPAEFGALVALTVAGAAAWFDRSAAARAASIAVVERMLAARAGTK